LEAFGKLSLDDQRHVLEVLGAMKKGEDAEAAISCLSSEAAKLTIDVIQKQKKFL
jgi:hypothetical protein